jgi:NAD(P)-dependent dehydrogenase (short-subunit alcohol dehydrogenase family)
MARRFRFSDAHWLTLVSRLTVLQLRVLAPASAALAEGDTVVGTVRTGSFSLDHDKGILHIVDGDLSDGDAAGASVAESLEHAGRIDVIVNDAGYGLLGALENATDAEVERLFAVDVVAPFRIIRTACA